MYQLPRLGKRELICLLLFTCNYLVSVWRGLLFLWVLGMGYVILFRHSLSLPYNYLQKNLYPSKEEKKTRLMLMIHRRAGKRLNACFEPLSKLLSKLKYHKSNRKAMDRIWCNQKPNPSLKTKIGNKKKLQIHKR